VDESPGVGVEVLLERLGANSSYTKGEGKKKKVHSHGEKRGGNVQRLERSDDLEFWRTWRPRKRYLVGTDEGGKGGEKKTF